jgi:Tol biopolymer transport system component
MSINHRRNISTILLIVTLFITSCSPSREKIEIIFEANINGAQDIYRISNLKSQAVERLTFTPDDSENFLLVSDDGKYASFLIHGPDEASAWDTYKLDLESLDATLLNNRESGLPPTYPLGWAADKYQILVPDYQGEALYKINLENESVEKVELPSLRQIRPTHCQYSYDKKLIACDLFDKWTNPIISSYIYVPETKDEIQLGDSSEFCFQPEWSPAEDKILLRCFSPDENASQIYLYEVVEGDTIYAQEIINVPYARPSLRMRSDAYAWSPDGGHFIATSCTISGEDYLFTLFNADGSLNKHLSPKNMTDDMIITDVAWSPDGQNILYIAGKDEESLNIYMMNADGSGNYALTTEPSNYSSLWVYSKP